MLTARRPSATTSPMPTVIATPAGCTDLAGLIENVTFPDDTPVVAGEAFRKVWRVRNEGTCTWTSDYAVLFSSGERMNGALSVPLTNTVRPGETADLAIDLVAPTTPGTYRGYWLLRNDRGLLFGMPTTGVNPLWVQVLMRPPGKHRHGRLGRGVLLQPRAARDARPHPTGLGHRLHVGQWITRSGAPIGFILRAVDRIHGLQHGNLPVPRHHG